MHRFRFATALVLTALPFLVAAACSASGSSRAPGGLGAGGSGDPAGSGGDRMGGSDPGFGGGSTGPGVSDPCAEAAKAKSYIGCDFWPTVTANAVWSIFDYAVVVANAGSEPAEVSVTRGAMQVAIDTVPPNELRIIYLPWVPELKGPDGDTCTYPSPFPSTVKVEDGAYHLVTSRPVTVYQFNAIEYAPQGGPPGKDWSGCRELERCDYSCLSYSNDASLLLPTTALTGNYRVTGLGGWRSHDISGVLAITGTQENTTVTVKLASNGVIQEGGGIAAASAGGQVEFVLQAGEVAELNGTSTSDFSGSLVQADKPVQVIFAMPSVTVPYDRSAADHIEESVFPAETLGRRYFVTVPTAPSGRPVGHGVRIYGNVDGTVLTYPSGAPSGAPATIDAGQVVDLSVVDQDFEIAGDHEFAVATFQLSGSLLDSGQKGDPSQSLATAVEQYREKYVFLAPGDYDVNYVDIVQPMDATLTLDGAPIDIAPVAIGSGFGVARVELPLGNSGAHLLEATAPVGIQVLGYGTATSYQYPGGSDLIAIAPPPIR
jgi:hypothetical protein